MEEFKRTTNGFSYVYNKSLKPKETVILKLPPVSPNKRGINDIGWQANGAVTLYATLSCHPERENTMWQKIDSGDDINKTAYALKIECGDAACRFMARVILC